MIQWLNLVVCVLLLLKAEGSLVPLTLVENALSKGAGEELYLSSYETLILQCHNF